MAKTKVHYRHPKLGYDACGLAGSSLTAQLTSDISEVTCRHCLNTVAGKKRVGGVKPKGEKKVKMNLTIDRKLRDTAKYHKLNCSELLEKAILEHLIK